MGLTDDVPLKYTVTIREIYTLAPSLNEEGRTDDGKEARVVDDDNGCDGDDLDPNTTSSGIGI